MKIEEEFNIMDMEQTSDVVKVLIHEIDNRNGVYLYLEGDAWCAYERSAYYLASLNVPVILKKEIVRDGYDVILLKAFFAVDDMCLPLAPRVVLRSVADDNLMFQLKDRMDDGFSEWKATQLNKLPA